MKPVTNIHIVRTGQVAMASMCLSMVIYVVSQLVIG